MNLIKLSFDPLNVIGKGQKLMDAHGGRKRQSNEAFIHSFLDLVEKAANIVLYPITRTIEVLADYEIKFKTDQKVDQLFEAVSKNDDKKVDELLSNVPWIDIEAVNDKGQTLLMVAAIQGWLPSINRLMENRASPLSEDTNGNSALALANIAGNPQAYEFMQDKMETIRQTRDNYYP